MFLAIGAQLGGTSAGPATEMDAPASTKVLQQDEATSHAQVGDKVQSDMGCVLPVRQTHSYSYYNTSWTHPTNFAAQQAARPLYNLTHSYEHGLVLKNARLMVDNLTSAITPQVKPAANCAMSLNKP